MEGILSLPPAATLGSTVFAALDELLPAAPWRRMWLLGIVGYSIYHYFSAYSVVPLTIHHEAKE